MFSRNYGKSRGPGREREHLSDPWIGFRAAIPRIPERYARAGTRARARTWASGGFPSPKTGFSISSLCPVNRRLLNADICEMRARNCESIFDLCMATYVCIRNIRTQVRWSFIAVPPSWYRADYGGKRRPGLQRARKHAVVKRGGY